MWVGFKLEILMTAQLLNNENKFCIATFTTFGCDCNNTNSKTKYSKLLLFVKPNLFNRF